MGRAGEKPSQPEGTESVCMELRGDCQEMG